MRVGWHRSHGAGRLLWSLGEMELGQLERERLAKESHGPVGTRASEPRKDGAVVADLRRGDLV